MLGALHPNKLVNKANNTGPKRPRPQPERPPPFDMSTVPEVFRAYVKDFVAGRIFSSEYEAVQERAYEENEDMSYMPEVEVEDSTDIMSREFEHEHVEEVEEIELEDRPRYRYLKDFRETAHALELTKEDMFRSYDIDEKNITYSQDGALDGAIESVMDDFPELWTRMNTVLVDDLVAFTDATADLVLRMVQLHADLSGSVDDLPEQYDRLTQQWKDTFTPPDSDDDE